MSTSHLGIYSRWLEAHIDRSAGLTTLPRNAILADVTGTGDYHLLITDLKFEKDTKSRLKVYKGTLLTSDQPLQSLPNSIICFYADQLEPRIPVIAVACGSELLLYKNLKPFYKFKVPCCPLSEQEAKLWSDILDKKDFVTEELLQGLKSIPFSVLTSRSQHILNLQNPQKIEMYVRKSMKTMPMKDNVITCMTTLAKSSHDQGAMACPVIATEYGNIYILDPQNLSVLNQANTCNIPSNPFIMKCNGIYDVEFRIVIITRENHICLLRKGWLEGKVLLQLTSDIVDMVLISGDNFIVVATSDKELHCYTKRGQKLWTSKTPTLITCLCLVPLDHISTNLVAVGLKNGLIQLYQGRFPVDQTSVAEASSVITFGQLGQEENVMVIITMSGSINFKILKRTADFSGKIQESSSVLQSKPLPLPKRSKLFLEQSIRERENAPDIHRAFQQDLMRLRLRAAQALAANVHDQTGIGSEKEQIRLSAQVLGLGPKFTVILSLENINPDQALLNLTVVFHINPKYYELSRYVFNLPMIPPSYTYKMDLKAKEVVRDLNNEDTSCQEEEDNFRIIKVFVSNFETTRPLLVATINMPPTELI